MKDANASAIGTTFLNFGIVGNNYQAASSLGGTDGRVLNTAWARTGDFGFWMDGNGNGPSELYAMTTNGTSQGGTGSSSALAGGIGSGVSYDYAVRMFRQGDAGGSIQFFFDLTAMETLYGPGSPTLGPSGWNPTASARIGDIGSSLTVAMYNSNSGFVNGSQVAFGVSVVPEPSNSLVLGAISISTLAFARRRKPNNPLDSALRSAPNGSSSGLPPKADS
jgi:hypothetical protein